MRSDILRRVTALLWGTALLAFAAPPRPATAQEADPDEPEVERTDAEPEGNTAEDAEPGRNTSPGQVNRKVRNPAMDEVKRLEKLYDLTLEELALRDEQVRAVNELFEDQIEAVRELARDLERRARDNAAEIREVEELIAEARRDRDRDELRRLARELRELRGSDARLWEMAREFHNEVSEELDEEQASTFQKLIRMTVPGSRQQEGSLNTVRLMRRALREVRLDAEQNEAIRRHFRAFMEQQRNSRQEGRQNTLDDQIDELYDAILKELDDEQAARFEETLEKLEEQMKRRAGRSGDRERFDRPRSPEVPGADEEAGEEAEEDLPDPDDEGFDEDEEEE